MKMKSFTMFMVSGLFVGSLAFVVPAMADDMSNSGSGSSMQPSSPSDDNSMGSGMGSGMSDSNTSNNDNSGSANSTDRGSPDTATGDDDY